MLFKIEDDQIYAKITQKDGMVVFLDNKEKYNGPHMAAKIATQVSDWCSLHPLHHCNHTRFNVTHCFSSRLIFVSNSTRSLKP